MTYDVYYLEYLDEGCDEVEADHRALIDTSLDHDIFFGPVIEDDEYHKQNLYVTD